MTIAELNTLLLRQSETLSDLRAAFARARGKAHLPKQEEPALSYTLSQLGSGQIWLYRVANRALQARTTTPVLESSDWQARAETLRQHIKVLNLQEGDTLLVVAPDSPTPLTGYVIV